MDNEDLNSVPIVPMKLPKRFDQLDEWTTSMFLFESALKEINTKIEILNNEFLHIHHLYLKFLIFF